MRRRERWISRVALVSFAVLLAMTVGSRVVRGQAEHVRWDIVSVNFAAPFTVSPDGGILVVSCTGVAAPASMFEGITASKGYVDYWNRVAPAGGVDANRTLFHIQ